MNRNPERHERSNSDIDSEEDEPMQLQIPEAENNNADLELPSILLGQGRARRARGRIILPEELTVTVKEFSADCWPGVKSYTSVQIIDSYKGACAKHNLVVRDKILKQLQDIRNNRDYSAVLDMRDVTDNWERIETLEAIIRKSTFRIICLAQLTCHVEVTNMLSYYQPTKSLVLEDLHGITEWSSLAEYIASSNVLKCISLQASEVEQEHIRLIFQCGVNLNKNLTTVSLNRIQLANSLSLCLKYVREVYLISVKLKYKGAENLAVMFEYNTNLRLVDISHNMIRDRGLAILKEGLISNTKTSAGIEVFIVKDNLLTSKSGVIFAAILTKCPRIRVLNLGHNKIGNRGMKAMQAALEASKTIRGLGLKYISLESAGLNLLIAACSQNKSLRAVYLRGNTNIELEALNDFLNLIPKTGLVKVDIDEANPHCKNPAKYIEIRGKIRYAILKNRVLERDHTLWESKAFLNNEPPGNLSCEPVLGSSTCDERASVLRVSKREQKANIAAVRESTRFTVVPVEPSCSYSSLPSRLQYLSNYLSEKAPSGSDRKRLIQSRVDYNKEGQDDKNDLSSSNKALEDVKVFSATSSKEDDFVMETDSNDSYDMIDLNP